MRTTKTKMIQLCFDNFWRTCAENNLQKRAQCVWRIVCQRMHYVYGRASLCSVSVQDLQKRCPGKISIQEAIWQDSERDLSFCASLHSRNADGHATGAILWRFTGKMPDSTDTILIEHLASTVSSAPLSMATYGHSVWGNIMKYMEISKALSFDRPSQYT